MCNDIVKKLHMQIQLSKLYEHKTDLLYIRAARLKMESENRIELQKKRIQLDLQMMSQNIDNESICATEKIKSMALYAKKNINDIERIEHRLARERNSILFFQSLHHYPKILYPPNTLKNIDDDSYRDYKHIIVYWCCLYSIGLYFANFTK
jgi:hypothetical protein